MIVSFHQPAAKELSKEESAHDAERRKHFQRLGSATFVGKLSDTFIAEALNAAGSATPAGKGIASNR